MFRRIAYHVAFFALLVLCCEGAYSRDKIGYFWHVSDIRLNHNFTVDATVENNCQRKEGDVSWSRRGSSIGQFGSYFCDPPWPILHSAVEFMNKEYRSKIQFLILGGSYTSIDKRVVGDSDQFMNIVNVTTAWSRYFGKEFILPVLGMDDPFVNIDGERNELPMHLNMIFRKFLSNDAMKTFERGGYYMHDESDVDLRLVFLNTQLFELANEDPFGQWKWLETLLAYMERHRKKVYIFGHVAPGHDELAPLNVKPIYQEIHSKRLIDNLVRYKDTIVASFFTHFRSDSFRILYDDAGEPASLMLFNPSLTPRRRYGFGNPSIRCYKYETHTGKLLDYTQYYLDLRESNRNGTLKWKLQYKLKSFYDIKEITPKAYDALARSFLEPNSPSFKKFFKVFFGSTTTFKFNIKPPGCGDDYRDECGPVQNIYCSVKNIFQEAFKKCISQTGLVKKSSAVYVYDSRANITFISIMLALVYIRQVI